MKIIALILVPFSKTAVDIAGSFLKLLKPFMDQMQMKEGKGKSCETYLDSIHIYNITWKE